MSPKTSFDHVPFLASIFFFSISCNGQFLVVIFNFLCDFWRGWENVESVCYRHLLHGHRTYVYIFLYQTRWILIAHRRQWEELHATRLFVHLFWRTKWRCKTDLKWLSSNFRFLPRCTLMSMRIFTMGMQKSVDEVFSFFLFIYELCDCTYAVSYTHLTLPTIYSV